MYRAVDALFKGENWWLRGLITAGAFNAILGALNPHGPWWQWPAAVVAALAGHRMGYEPENPEE